MKIGKKIILKITLGESPMSL